MAVGVSVYRGVVPGLGPAVGGAVFAADGDAAAGKPVRLIVSGATNGRIG